MTANGFDLRCRALATGRRLASSLGLLLVASTLTLAHAEPPGSGTVAGLSLGDTPSSIVAGLREKYPQCDLQRSIYHALPGEKAGPLAIVAINEGTINLCHGSPEDANSTDHITVRFAHPAVAADRGAFEIHVDRHYPDPALSPQKQVRYPLDKVMARLQSEYGRPSDEKRERRPSASAGLAKSLGVGADVKRDDETLRLLWAPKGRLVADEDPAKCDCGDRYVIAEIEVTRSPVTRPANRPYVTRLSVFVQQADVRRRQDAWNAQWVRQSRQRQEEPAPQGAPSRESSPAAPSS
jgi:hypothetical protein